MEYSFTLKFKLPPDEALTDEQLMLRLGAAGCTDALVGLGMPGYLSLEFSRHSDSAMDAMLSGLEDVKKALPEAELVEAAPDFMGLTDIADLAGVTRQYMRKLFLSNAAMFPPPVHGGSAMVWHLAPVLQFMHARNYAISTEVIDVAYAAMQLNISKEKKLLDIRADGAASKYLHA